MGETSSPPALSAPASAAWALEPPAPTASARKPGDGLRVAVVYALIFAISLADALTPAGLVVGIFLGVPIILASMFTERRHVVASWIASMLCFVLAALLGEGPMTPEYIWVPNRLYVLLSLFAFGWLALQLQQRRLALEAERAAAEAARDLTHLLHSLMAHDLRAPLVLARQGFEMVRGAADGNWPPNLALVDEVDARLTRSLRTIELVLDAARTELGESAADAATPPVMIAGELEEEVAGFRANAETRRKSLVVEVMPTDLVLRVNAAVLRQSVAILVDNALRYSLPGTIHVLAQAHGSYLWVHVRDEGPGIAAAEAPGQGSGIGLRLSRLLAQRAGGSLELLRNGAQGTEFVLRLPARPR